MLATFNFKNQRINQWSISKFERINISRVLWTLKIIRPAKIQGRNQFFTELENREEVGIFGYSGAAKKIPLCLTRPHQGGTQSRNHAVFFVFTHSRRKKKQSRNHADLWGASLTAEPYEINLIKLHGSPQHLLSFSQYMCFGGSNVMVVFLRY